MYMVPKYVYPYTGSTVSVMHNVPHNVIETHQISFFINIFVDTHVESYINTHMNAECRRQIMIWIEGKNDVWG